ncbi:MAG: LysR family transcriptional regulator [Planctomycetes bacterium]|nr:LysR family transcriptional regulator [Planctomycetota bacterium]
MNIIPYIAIMIELRHLRALKAIAEHKNLTAAADALMQTQSALSHLLSDFERRSSLTLLDRSTRPIRLTQAGQRLLRCAEDVLPLIEQCESDLKNTLLDNSNRLHIATECYGCLEWLIPAMDACRTQQPHLELDLRLGSSFDRLGDLIDGSIDMVITPDQTQRKNIRYLPLFEFEMVLICSPSHRLAQRRYIKAKDLSDETLLTYPVSTCRLDVYTRFLEPAGIHVGKRITSELTAMIEQKVAFDHGVAVLPAWTVSASVRSGRLLTRPLGQKGMHSQLYAALRNNDQRGHGENFAHIARHTAQHNVPDILLLR